MFGIRNTRFCLSCETTNHVNIYSVSAEVCYLPPKFLETLDLCVQESDCGCCYKSEAFLNTPKCTLPPHITCAFCDTYKRLHKPDTGTSFQRSVEDDVQGTICGMEEDDVSILEPAAIEAETTEEEVEPEETEEEVEPEETEAGAEALEDLLRCDESDLIEDEGVTFPHDKKNLPNMLYADPEAALMSEEEYMSFVNAELDYYLEVADAEVDTEWRRDLERLPGPVPEFDAVRGWDVDPAGVWVAAGDVVDAEEDWGQGPQAIWDHEDVGREQEWVPEAGVVDRRDEEHLIDNRYDHYAIWRSIFDERQGGAPNEDEDEIGDSSFLCECDTCEYISDPVQGHLIIADNDGVVSVDVLNGSHTDAVPSLCLAAYLHSCRSGEIEFVKHYIVQEFFGGPPTSSIALRRCN
ncbi:hypothetical protein [Eastern grey kangaroopox virus]|uniref:Uncharacterized protein n=1 Tax=Eastern grey kangaroopox virus TaxID=2042482 RepID=A0A2C9DSW7_9POXV|nr:hypothetical protein KM541_gp004 [Eastern grey kangaroopox virus]ATI21100.1 hypothetical protein [Eastern grey kangaroopox virus]ATX75003.1 hypothetical protein EKPV-NSW-ORF009 [Eastern grey kangaroopox virus]